MDFKPLIQRIHPYVNAHRQLFFSIGYFLILVVAFVALRDVALLGLMVFGFVFVTALTAPSAAPVEAPAHVRRFVLRTLAWGVLLAGLVAALNYVVNPYGTFAHRYLEPITLDARREKLALYSQYETAPDAIVFGSSRSFTAAPADIEALTGLRAFNASVDSAAPRDFVAFLNFMQERGHFPQVIIIGLTTEQVTAPFPDRADDAFSRYLDDSGRRLDDLRQYAELLTIDQTEASLRSLELKLEADRPAPYYRFEADGLGTFKQAISLEAAVDNYLDWWGDLYNERTHLNEPELAYLREVLDRAQAHGARVIIYIPPFHPTMEAHFQQQNYPRLLDETRHTLEALQDEYGFALYDFTDLDSFGGTEFMFHDGVHSTRQLGRLMLERMLSDLRPDA
jgi:hypothetical protein